MKRRVEVTFAGTSRRSTSTILSYAKVMRTKPSEGLNFMLTEQLRLGITAGISSWNFDVVTHRPVHCGLPLCAPFSPTSFFIVSLYLPLYHSLYTVPFSPTYISVFSL
jgi:hypothetical protein